MLYALCAMRSSPAERIRDRFAEGAVAFATQANAVLLAEAPNRYGWIRHEN